MAYKAWCVSQEPRTDLLHGVETGFSRSGNPEPGGIERGAVLAPVKDALRAPLRAMISSGASGLRHGASSNVGAV